VALTIQQQVAGFQISVQQVGRVHVFKAFEALIDNVLFVNILKDICPNNCMQISVHKVENEVNVSVVLCPDDIL
jgi:isopenicillin N synthase-like dioxygenase